MSALRAERLSRFAAVDLYPVTCEALSDGRSDLEVLEGIVAGGARIVQLRDKDASKAQLYAKACAFRSRTAAAGILLLINDHLDIALAVGADGVHLGQDDLPLSVARKLAPDLILGQSTHGLAEALRAEREDADYINIGPIFATGTKPGLSEFLGPETIAEVAPEVALPFTVMGGINADNLDQVLAQGARKIAVVTAVTRAPDIAAAVRELRHRIAAAG